MQKCILHTSLRGTGLSIVLQGQVLMVWVVRLVLFVFTLRLLVSPIFCPTPGLFACVLGMLLSIVRYIDSTYRAVSKHGPFFPVLRRVRQAQTTHITLDTCEAILVITAD